MTNAPHTPGPWSYNRDEGGTHGHVISTGDYIICELPDAGDGASPDTETNARLIGMFDEIRWDAALPESRRRLGTAG
jgi:hypothetical protein